MATATKIPLATTTASGSVSSIDFTSISGSYTDLILIANVRISALEGFKMRFNGDTGTNYSYTIIRGNGTSATSYRVSNKAYIETYGVSDAGTNTLTSIIYQINNYSNANTYKSALIRSNNPSGSSSDNQVEQGVALWRNTNAITQLTLYTGVNFGSNSTFTLYGVL